MKVLLATFFSQVRPARPAGARSRARRYGIVLGPDDGARLIVHGTKIGPGEKNAREPSVMATMSNPAGIRSGKHTK